MPKLVFLKVLDSDSDRGFIVNMQIFDEHDNHIIDDVKGRLPPSNKMLQSYDEWRKCYRKIVLNPRVRLESQSVTETEIIKEVRLAKNRLSSHINEWLKPDGEFITIWTSLLTHLKDENEDIRMIIKTDDLELKQLPFFLWKMFFERYHRAEIGISLPFKSILIENRIYKVKILAVLAGSLTESGSTQIKISRDLEILKNTLNSESNAEIIYLKSPERDELANILEEQKPQILFFAGHTNNAGDITLSDTESITIEDLKFDLIKAVKTGLKLAIFNSCNGVSIASQLSDLHISNIIVMREALPDKAAHLFLQYFLEEFVVGKPLNRVVRRARERLNRYEKDFPGVMSLPMIWQNHVEPVLTWESLGGIARRTVSQQITENNFAESNQSKRCNHCSHENLCEASYCEACFTPFKIEKTSEIINEDPNINSSKVESVYTQIELTSQPPFNETLLQQKTTAPFPNESNQSIVCNNCRHVNPYGASHCEACSTPFKIEKISEIINKDPNINSSKVESVYTQIELASQTLFDETLLQQEIITSVSSKSNRLIICDICKHENIYGSAQCEFCFTTLLKPCKVCGDQNSIDSLFCGHCGEQYDRRTNNEKNVILFNRYGVIKTISENDFSKIVLVKDTHLSNDNKRVIKKTKFVSSDLSTCKHYQRLFEAEMKILEKLKKCDQVQRSIAYFEAECEFYLILEYIYGQEFSGEIKQKRALNDSEVINILRELLGILNSIHENGIIHLDVNPSNLIRRKKDGKLILINFNVAKDILIKSNQSSEKGTYGYMSIEDILGNPQINSDIYSLGMIIIQMLTKLEPRRLSRSHDVEIEWQIHVKSGFEISDELAEIICKMVKFDFLKRYQSVKEVLADLNSLNHQSKEEFQAKSKPTKINIGKQIRHFFPKFR
jgi:tRNA A-37 threonylcarbamoyl transferase component Bud32